MSRGGKFSFRQWRNRLGDRLGDKLDRVGDRLDERMEREDPIYTQPIHRTREEREAPSSAEDRVLVKGRVDVGFLFIVIALAVFGAKYSASK